MKNNRGNNSSLPYRSESAGSLSDPLVWKKGVRFLRKQDPILARIIERVGPIRFEPDINHYDAIVGSIIYQQLAGSAARAILNRFKDLYGGRLPNPKEYLATSKARLRSSGLSPQKISYIRDLAERLLDGRLDLKRLDGLSDEDAMSELDAVHGIGRWTAEMFLLFKLARTDVLPVDDLGLQKAAKIEYRLRKLPSREKFEKIAMGWHPYSSISTLYLWKSGEKPDSPAKW